MLSTVGGLQVDKEVPIEEEESEEPEEAAGEDADEAEEGSEDEVEDAGEWHCIDDYLCSKHGMQGAV